MQISFVRYHAEVSISALKIGINLMPFDTFRLSKFNILFTKITCVKVFKQCAKMFSIWPHLLESSTGYTLTYLTLDKMAANLADDIFNCILLNENDRIPIQISLKYVPRTPVDNMPVVVQVMAWRWTGDKPLPEPMMTRFIDAYMRH